MDETARRGTVMAVVAHPDDAEFNVGGTLALWIAEGWRAVVVVVTRGDKGSDDPAMTADRLAALREREQLDAAAFLGVDAVEFLGHPDGTLEPSLAVRRDIARCIRLYRPDRLIVTDPAEPYTERYIQHPDHLATAQAALAATYAARDRLTFPDLLDEGLALHGVREVYVHTGREPDVWVDIGAVMAKKREALRLHRSQISEEFLAIMERIAAEAAVRAPEPGLSFAESFRRIRLA